MKKSWKDLLNARIIQSDKSSSEQYHHLQSSDTFLYFGEYAPRRGYHFGPMNDLIINLKKPMDRRYLPEWIYKEDAIRCVSGMIRKNFNLSMVTFVPMPPSQAKSDPLYDDRMVRVLQRVGGDVDVRELITQPESVQSAHGSNAPRDPQEIEARYEFDETQTETPPRQYIGIVDDVLTTGAHFIAVKSILQEHYNNEIFGLFVARCVWV